MPSSQKCPLWLASGLGHRNPGTLYSREIHPISEESGHGRAALAAGVKPCWQRSHPDHGGLGVPGAADTHVCTLSTYAVQNFTLEKFVECPPHGHKALILSRQLQALASAC